MLMPGRLDHRLGNPERSSRNEIVDAARCLRCLDQGELSCVNTCIHLDVIALIYASRTSAMHERSECVTTLVDRT